MEVKASRATEVTAKGATNGNRNGKGTMEENTNGATASDSQDEQAVTCFESFDDMQLAEGLLRGIYAYGFERPSLIQQRAIVPMTQGRDIIAQSQSGTGKTATFSIGLLQGIDTSVRTCQAIVLAPTRELAAQTQKVCLALGDYTGVIVREVVGGTNMRESIHELRQGAHVVVGTPGRVMDMIDKGFLAVQDLRIFVLDEADEMLQGGFTDQIYNIFRRLPTTVQVALFSATLPLGVLELTTQFMRDPLTIRVRNESLTLAGIKQFYVAVEGHTPAGSDEVKLAILCDLYESLTITQSIIYLSSRRRVEWLANELSNRDFTVSALHSDLSPQQRNFVMREFRSGSSRILLATDLLARGIDIQQVSLVINFDVPGNSETYIHRIGRSGRFGRKGVAINLVSRADSWRLQEIEKFYDTSIAEMPADFASLI